MGLGFDAKRNQKVNLIRLSWPNRAFNIGFTPPKSQYISYNQRYTNQTNHTYWKTYRISINYNFIFICFALVNFEDHMLIPSSSLIPKLN